MDYRGIMQSLHVALSDIARAELPVLIGELERLFESIDVAWDDE